MPLSQIAQHKATNEFVDVHSVPGGRHCNCICPSCKQPLIAKQGQVNDWHFSHDPKFDSVFERTKCEISWSVAIKLMIIQLLKAGNSIYLPSYIKEESNVEYQSTSTDNSPFDIVLHIEGSALGVIFTPKKPLTNEEYKESIVDGVIQFNTQKIKERYEMVTFDSITSYLNHVISKAANFKTWIYHHRENKVNEAIEAREKLKNRHALQIINKQSNQAAQPESTISNTIKPIQKTTKTQFHCSRCNITYQGELPGPNSCPECESHLYRVEFK